MIYLIAISTFIFVTVTVMGLYWLIYAQPSSASERLRQLGQPNSPFTPVVEPRPAEVIAERMAKPIYRLVPPSPREATKLQRKLLQAGYRSPGALVIFRALQLTLLVAFPLITGLWCLSRLTPLDNALLWVSFAFLLGFILPRRMLDRMIKNRQQRLRWGLADALDLMVVSVDAGLGLNAAMQRVSAELRSIHPDISSEFEIANLEIRVGRDREEALRNLADRTGVDDLRSLCAMLIQADRFGTSITRAIRIYADSLRTKRRQRAEQAAQKAAVKLLIPLTLFLLPAFLIVILGPAVLNMINYFLQ
jgi:tight adherence protein C